MSHEYKVFAFNTNTFAQKKVVGRTVQYDVDVQGYLYINFDWKIIKNRCKGVKQMNYIWDAQTAEPLS